MKKKILALALALVLVFTLAACSSTAEEETTEEVTETVVTDPANVLAINGPTAMSMVELFDNEAYNFTFTSDATEVVSLMSTGAVDIAACPLNLAANLFVKMEGEVQMIAINTLGVLYVVVNTDVVGDIEINSIEDLAGQTVYTAGEGTTVEYILDYLFTESDMVAGEDFTLEYLSEHSEVSTKVAAGEAGIVILPEPFVSVALAANEDLEVALSVTDEWDAVSDTQLAQGCIIASTAFIEENPEAVAQFIEDCTASVEFMNNETEEAAPILVEYGVLASEAIVLNATENCNIVFITGEEMAEIAQANLEVYYNADPTSVGGSLPTEELYYIGE